MTPVREQVLAAVAAVLEAIPGHDFTRNAPRESEAGGKPALRMFDGGHAIEDDAGTGVRQARIGFTVEIFTSKAPLGTALNASYAALGEALLADRSLGGLALDVRELEMGDPEIVLGDGHPAYIGAPVDFEAVIWTGETDLSALG